MSSGSCLASVAGERQVAVPALKKAVRCSLHPEAQVGHSPGQPVGTPHQTAV